MTHFDQRLMLPSWDAAADVELYMWSYADVEFLSTGTMKALIADMTDSMIYSEEGRSVRKVWALTQWGPVECLRWIERRHDVVHVRLTWLDAALWQAGESDATATVTRRVTFSVPNV